MKKWIFILIPIFILAGCGAGESGDPKTTDTSGGCCKVCKTGKACGDSCISRDKNCTKDSGCACNGLSKVAALVGNSSVPYVFNGIITGVNGISYSSGSEFGVVDNGKFTYELLEPIAFTVGDIVVGVTDKPSLDISELGSNDNEKANIEWFLTHLDTDYDSSNGINIDEATHDKYKGKTIDFKLEHSRFIENAQEMMVAN